MGEISVRDAFGKAIIDTIVKYDLRRNLEIGSRDGTGLTICFIHGMKQLSGDKSLTCLEIDEGRFNDLRKNMVDFTYVQPLNMSSISMQNFNIRDFEKDVWASPYCRIKESITKADVLSWYLNDLKRIQQSGEGFLERSSESFDSVLIDGSSFAAYDEFRLLRDRTNCFFLDDSHTSFKCSRIRAELADDSRWIMLHDFPDTRNGATIFLRKVRTCELFTSWYTDELIARNNDTLRCLEENAKNPLITKIHLLIDQEKPRLVPTDIAKIATSSFQKRPMYQDFFNLMDVSSCDIRVLANSDILFDESLRFVKNLDIETCYALTRWEQGKETPVFLNRSWSQDAWIFRGKIRNVAGDFELGRLGCDGKIAYELNAAGYRVLNPSKTIKILHVQSERKKGRYDGHNIEDAVAPPKMSIEPIALL